MVRREDVPYAVEELEGVDDGIDEEEGAKARRHTEDRGRAADIASSGGCLAVDGQQCAPRPPVDGQGVPKHTQRAEARWRIIIMGRFVKGWLLYLYRGVGC